MVKADPILITGIPRSGTSLITAAIIACGAFGGRMAKKSMFSNDKIRERVVKPYLQELGADSEGQYKFPTISAIPTNWKVEISKIIRSEGYKIGQWVYKDSRTALIWPIWEFHFPRSKWLIVRRRTGDIIESCIKTGYMTAFKDAGIQKMVSASSEQDGWRWMVHEYEKKFINLIEKGIDYKIIWPERMVNGDFTQLKETVDWLGLQWNEQALEYIKPLLWGRK
jgi:hypothetical protein